MAQLSRVGPWKAAGTPGLQGLAEWWGGLVVSWLDEVGCGDKDRRIECGNQKSRVRWTTNCLASVRVISAGYIVRLWVLKKQGLRVSLLLDLYVFVFVWFGVFQFWCKH